MTAYTPRALSTNRLQQVANQPAHGFSVGNVVIYDFNGFPLAPWFLALANMTSSCFGSMMVSFVIDADNFVVTQMGHVANITAQTLSQGGNYYLSPTNAPPTQLTLIRPSSIGQVVLPCFVADSPTSGFFFGGSGDAIESGEVLAWNVVTVDTPMSVSNGYITNSGANINLLLPSSAIVGDSFKAANYGAGNFTITQGALQSQALIGGTPSTPGVGGSVASTNQYSSITGVCVVAATPAHTTWLLMDVVGNYTVV